MTDEVVHGVGLGGVVRNGVVPDVLRRREDPLRERREEIARLHESLHRPDPETRALVELLVEVRELRDRVPREAQQVEGLVVLAAAVRWEELGELRVDRAPRLRLVLEKLHARERLSQLVFRRELRDLVPPLAVVLVVKTRVVGIELDEIRFHGGSSRTGWASRQKA